MNTFIFELVMLFQMYIRGMNQNTITESVDPDETA